MASYNMSIEKLTEYISHGMQEELERRIKDKLQRIADEVVVEVAREVAKTLSYNVLSNYHAPTGETVVEVYIDRKKVSPGQVIPTNGLPIC